jgi:hypothetical protein
VGAAFGLSYGQLSTPAQQLFRRLALVPGADFAGPLAAVLADAGPADAEDALDELAELGLLEPALGGRYQFHDLVRLFARERLAAEDPPADRAAATARMHDWLLDVAVVAGRCCEPGYGPPADGRFGAVPLASAGDATDWLQAEGDNWLTALRSAAAAGRHARVVEVAEAMHWFSDRWAYWGHWDEVFHLSSTAASALNDPAEETRQLNYLSWAQVAQGDPTTGLTTAVRAQELATSTGDRTQLAWGPLLRRRCQPCSRPDGGGRWRGPGVSGALRLPRRPAGWLQAAQIIVDSELRGGRPAAAIDQLRRMLTVLEEGRTPGHIVEVGRASPRRLGRAYRSFGRLRTPRLLPPGSTAAGRQGVLTPRVDRGDARGGPAELADPDGAAAATGEPRGVRARPGPEQSADGCRGRMATARTSP